MDAVEYLKQVKRICNGIGNGSQLCSECPLFYESGPMRCMANVVVYTSNDFDESVPVEIVEKWAREHPAKTRTAKLLEVFPDADVYDGFPDICPGRLDRSYKKVKCNEKANCTDCEREYWLEEIE